MAYRHEDDYRREKLIRKQRTSKKTYNRSRKQKFIRGKTCAKIKKNQKGIFLDVEMKGFRI